MRAKDLIKEFGKLWMVGISIFVAVVILLITNYAISDVSKETVCKSRDFSNQLLCFFFTNKLVSALLFGFSVFFIIDYYQKKYQ